jgi:hypothetical protein
MIAAAIPVRGIEAEASGVREPGMSWLLAGLPCGREPISGAPGSNAGHLGEQKRIAYEAYVKLAGYRLSLGDVNAGWEGEKCAAVLR